jgi:hypothetical protein
MDVNTTCCAEIVCTLLMLIRMKNNYAHPAVQICADAHFFVLVRTGVSVR